MEQIDDKIINQLINDSFASDNEFKLPDNFADKVTSAIQRREQLKSDLIEYLQLCLVIIALFLISTGFYYYIDKDQVINVLKIASNNISLIAMLTIIFNFIIFADKVLLRFLFSNYKRNTINL